MQDETRQGKGKKVTEAQAKIEEKVTGDKTRAQISERLLSDEGVRASISLRAYEIYEQRGCEPGCELEDWLQAESEILPPLIEKEFHRAPRSREVSSEAPAGKPVTVKEKPAKKTARLFNGKRPADEKGALSH